MEKKQTALQWLLEQWPILNSQLPSYVIDEALQMEREQIEDAFYEGVDGGSGELYYKETYGGKDE
jgi:hypothetical protein